MFVCCWASTWWFWSLSLLFLAPGWSCLCSHDSGWFWLVGLDDWMISRVGLGVLEQEQGWTSYCSLLFAGGCLSGRLGELFQLVLPFYTIWWFSLAMTHIHVPFLVTKPWLACCVACTAACEPCVCLWWNLSSWLLQFWSAGAYLAFGKEFGQWQVSWTLVLTPWIVLLLICRFPSQNDSGTKHSKTFSLGFFVCDQHL